MIDIPQAKLAIIKRNSARLKQLNRLGNQFANTADAIIPPQRARTVLQGASLAVYTEQYDILSDWLDEAALFCLVMSSPNTAEFKTFSRDTNIFQRIKAGQFANAIYRGVPTKAITLMRDIAAAASNPMLLSKLPTVTALIAMRGTAAQEASVVAGDFAKMYAAYQKEFAATMR